jgi:hypothetical protein
VVIHALFVARARFQTGLIHRAADPDPAIDGDADPRAYSAGTLPRPRPETADAVDTSLPGESRAVPHHPLMMTHRRHNRDLQGLNIQVTNKLDTTTHQSAICPDSLGSRTSFVP